MNHFKLYVLNKGIKFYLVISIETKEFVVSYLAFDFLTVSYVNVTFKEQHSFSKT